MSNKSRFGFVVVFILILGIFATLCPAQMTQSESTVPYKSISPREESTIERTVIIALRHISQARADIHHKMISNAKSDLAEAARLLESLRNDLSTSTAKNLIQITRKRLEYEQPQQVLREFPVIYSSLDTISVYLPTDKAKLHIDRAKGYLEQNDKLKADKELVSADKSLIVVEVELPLLKVQNYVAKAQDYLAAKNAGKADKALQIAESRRWHSTQE